MLLNFTCVGRGLHFDSTIDPVALAAQTQDVLRQKPAVRQCSRSGDDVVTGSSFCIGMVRVFALITKSLNEVASLGRVLRMARFG